MKFGNLPEVVIYTEFGVEHRALPVGSREIEYHTGENGELLLDLVIVKQLVKDECVNCHFPERNHGKPFPPGASHVPCGKFEGIVPVAAVNPSEYVHIVTDVAHESHVFTEDQIKQLAKKGFTAYPGGQFPGGRWREIAAENPHIPDGYEEQLKNAGNTSEKVSTRVGTETVPGELIPVSVKPGETLREAAARISEETKPNATLELKPEGEEPPPIVN